MSDIVFQVPKIQEDYLFIESCLTKPDYISFINIEETSISSILIIIRDKNKIGIFIPNIHSITGISSSRPIIYILKEYRIFSSFAIWEMISYLFEVKKVDRLIIQVYNNIQMINCMKNFNIPMRGEIKNIRNLNDKLISMCFFDISFEKFLSLRGDFFE